MSRTTEWTIYCNGLDCRMNISSFESEADLFAKAEHDRWQLNSNGIDYCKQCSADKDRQV